MIKLCFYLYILNEVLLCDIVERVYVEITTSLERLTVLDLLLIYDVLLFYYLDFTHFDLFLPTGLAIKLFIIFGKIKTSVVQRFVKIFTGNILTHFNKFLLASH